MGDSCCLLWGSFVWGLGENKDVGMLPSFLYVTVLQAGSEQIKSTSMNMGDWRSIRLIRYMALLESATDFLGGDLLLERIETVPGQTEKHSS